MEDEEESKTAMHTECGKFMKKYTTQSGKPYWKCKACNVLLQNRDKIKFV